MKKSIILLILTFWSIIVSAEKIEINGIFYNLNAKDNVAEVASSTYKYAGDVVIPSSVTYNNVEYGVTSIAREAFRYCSSLLSVSIPNSVASIGAEAFQYCSGLTSITIPNSVTNIGSNAFGHCSCLSSITIPNSVTTIGISAFSGCSGLTTVTIPNSVTSLSAGIFKDCSGLTSVTIPNSVTSIGEWAFNGCSGLTSVTIPNSVTSIGHNAFDGCSSLSSITIPSSVTSIGDNAFDGCSSLSSITIPSSVTSIGELAFNGCSGLTSITIPSSVTSIGTGVFQKCSGLTSITIPSSVTSIGELAFNGCSGLTSITIPSSVTNIGSGAFHSCSGLTSITIPSSVTSIGDGVLGGCIGLTSIIVETGNTKYDSRDKCNAIIETRTNTLIAVCNNTIIPNSVTNIGSEAFAYCRSITSVTIPNSVKGIGKFAFYGCFGLSSITIPNSVTSIGAEAFAYCRGLTSITIPNSVTNIGSNAFGHCYFKNVNFRNNTSMSSTGNQYWGANIIDQESSDGVLIKDNSIVYCRPWATSVTIPNNVTNIDNYAFSLCDKLLTIYSELTEPFNCGGVFSENTLRNGTLYVPKGTKELYTRFDGWREFLNIEEVGSSSGEGIWLSLKDSQGASKLKLKKGTRQELAITPESGWRIYIVFMNGQDITSQVKNGGSYTTPALENDAIINIVYEQASPSGVATARLSKADIKVVEDGVIISNAEPKTRCMVYLTDGQQVVNTVLEDESQKITLQKGQVYIMYIDGRTLKFSL